MNKVFKLKHVSGPHGDECSTYDIIFLKDNVKLYEFLEDLDPNEWGTIRLKVLNPITAKLDYATEDEKYDDIHFDYNRGEYKHEEDRMICAPYLYKDIDMEYHSWSNGGWSMMGYWLKIKS